MQGNPWNGGRYTQQMLSAGDIYVNGLKNLR
jgi:hypothetical protein